MDATAACASVRLEERPLIEELTIGNLSWNVYRFDGCSSPVCLPACPPARPPACLSTRFLGGEKQTNGSNGILRNAVREHYVLRARARARILGGIALCADPPSRTCLDEIWFRSKRVAGCGNLCACTRN